MVLHVYGEGQARKYQIIYQVCIYIYVCVHMLISFGIWEAQQIP